MGDESQGLKLKVASPCSANWASMTGDERVRYCSVCQKNVYNLSAMTAEQVLDLVRQREGQLCARFFQRTDGTVLTSDCPVGLALLKRGRKGVLRAGVAVGGVLAALLGGAVEVQHEREQRARELVTGEVESHSEEQRLFERVNLLFAEGKALASDNNWSAALAKFEEGRRRLESAGERLDDEQRTYLQRAAQEVANEKHLKRAQALLEQAELGAAWDEVQAVLPDSAQAGRAGELTKQIRGLVPARVAEVRQRIVTKDLPGADGLLGELERIDPDNAEVKDARHELESQTQPPPRSPSDGRPPFEVRGQILGAYRNGDLEEARKLARSYADQDDRIRDLGAQLDQFAACWPRARLGDGLTMGQCRSLDLLISGGHSAFSSTLGTAPLHRLTAEEQAHVKDLYMRAYVLKDDDVEEAISLFQQVLALTPPDHEYHVKARARLREMDQ